jgi:hypothetical protein
MLVPLLLCLAGPAGNPRAAGGGWSSEGARAWAN